MADKMTKREKRACFMHAKQHVVEAVEDALSEEYHSVMRVDGAVRPDMMAETSHHLESFLKMIRRVKLEDMPAR